MEDFASAAMMRLVRLGLARQNIGLGQDGTFPGAHVPLGTKRSILSEVLAAAGPQTLLRIGEAVDELPEEPALIALSAARDPHDLIDRWRRLERFVHSRHQVVVESAGEGRLVLQHLSAASDEPPTAAEDLLVFGTLVAFARRIGTEGLRARLAGDPIWRYDNGAWQEATPPVGTAVLEMTWAKVLPRHEPVRPGRSTVDALGQLLRGDLARRWSIRDAARALGLSTRSLQRALAQSGQTYSAVLAATRAAVAAEYLQSSRKSLGEIGFVCGYSDQSHFTRNFKTESALTPRAYRDSFLLSAR